MPTTKDKDDLVDAIHRNLKESANFLKELADAQHPHSEGGDEVTSGELMALLRSAQRISNASTILQTRVEFLLETRLLKEGLGYVLN